MNNSGMSLRALRGATTATANTAAAMEEAVAELIEVLTHRNNLKGPEVFTAIFSVTSDLNALFPAAIARRCEGWEGVALLDCQQMAVVGDLPRCIRVMLQAWLPTQQEEQHVYLRDSQKLRPDRSCNH